MAVARRHWAGIAKIRPYIHSDVTAYVRWYYVPDDTPWAPPSVFDSPHLNHYQLLDDPVSGTAGIYWTDEEYDLGAPPQVTMVTDVACGSAAAWAGLGDPNTDDLVVDEYGYPQCCYDHAKNVIFNIPAGLIIGSYNDTECVSCSWHGVASLTGSGAITTAAASVTRGAACSLTGAGAITAASGTVAFAGVSSFVGSGAITTASGTVTRGGAAALSGTAVLTGDGTVTTATLEDTIAIAPDSALPLEIIDYDAGSGTWLSDLFTFDSVDHYYQLSVSGSAITLNVVQDSGSSVVATYTGTVGTMAITLTLQSQTTMTTLPATVPVIFAERTAGNLIIGSGQYVPDYLGGGFVFGGGQYVPTYLGGGFVFGGGDDSL